LTGSRVTEIKFKDLFGKREPVILSVSKFVILVAFSMGSCFILCKAAYGATQSPPALLPINPGPNGYFEYRLNPGSYQKGYVEVQNLSDIGTTFDVYSVYGTTSEVTGVSYSQPNQSDSGVARWIKPQLSSIYLPPKKASKISFTATVPVDEASGDYVGGIAVESPNTSKKQPSSGSNNFTLNIETRVIVAIVIHVPGPNQYSMKLTKPKFGQESNLREVLYLPMNNFSNRLMKPYIKANIYNDKSLVASFAKQLDTFVPHTNISYPWYLNQLVLPPGCYRISEQIANDNKVLSAATFDSVCITSAVANVHPNIFNHPGNKVGGNWILYLIIGILSTLLFIILLVMIFIIILFKKKKEKKDEEEQSDVQSAVS
jgi:hypothetical protein